MLKKAVEKTWLRKWIFIALVVMKPVFQDCAPVVAIIFSVPFDNHKILALEQNK